MPYTKRTYYKKRYKPRKKFVSKAKKLVTGHGPTMLERIASGVGSVASLAKAVVPVIAAINTEAKYLDRTVSSTASFAAPNLINLSAMAQGTTEITRIGNSILSKNISVTIQLVPDMATRSYHCYRILLFVDKQQAGTPPNTTELFANSATTLFSQKNKNYTDRFVFLKDKFITIDANIDPTADALNANRVIKIFKKTDFHIRYIGTDATNASQGNNSLYLLIWPQDPTTGQGFSMTSRLNFTDN